MGICVSAYLVFLNTILVRLEGGKPLAELVEGDSPELCPD